MGLGAGYTLLVGLVPAPEPLVEAIQQIDVECTLDEASVLRIEFGISATPIGDWSILDLDPFRPLLPLQLRVQRGAGAPEALINAFVTEHRVTYSEGGYSKLQITALDATYAMNLEEKVKPWLNLPDSAIAAAVFGEHAIVPRVDPTSPVLTDPEGTTIQRGTDIRFLRRLARRSGFDCYVQPEPLSGLDVGHFHKRQLTGVPQAVLSVEFGDGDERLRLQHPLRAHAPDCGDRRRPGRADEVATARGRTHSTRAAARDRGDVAAADPPTDRPPCGHRAAHEQPSSNGLRRQPSTAPPGR